MNKKILCTLLSRVIEQSKTIKAPIIDANEEYLKINDIINQVIPKIIPNLKDKADMIPK